MKREAEKNKGRSEDNLTPQQRRERDGEPNGPLPRVAGTQRCDKKAAHAADAERQHDLRQLETHHHQHVAARHVRRLDRNALEQLLPRLLEEMGEVADGLDGVCGIDHGPRPHDAHHDVGQDRGGHQHEPQPAHALRGIACAQRPRGILDRRIQQQQAGAHGPDHIRNGHQNVAQRQVQQRTLRIDRREQPQQRDTGDQHREHQRRKHQALVQELPVRQTRNVAHEAEGPRRVIELHATATNRKGEG